MQQVAVAQVAISPPEERPGTKQGYNSTASKYLGATQIAIGAICFLLQVVMIGIHCALFIIGHGIWCGVFFVIAGAFGVVAGQTKRTGFIITFMILSIVAASFFLVPLIACASIGLIMDHGPYSYRYGRTEQQTSACVAMHGLLIALALLEGIIAIISSAICCGPLCCYSSRNTQGVVYYTQGAVQIDAATGQQVVALLPPQQQYVAPAPGQQQYVAVGAPTAVQYVPQYQGAYVAQPDMQAQGQQYTSNPPPYSPEMMKYTGEELPEKK